MAKFKKGDKVRIKKPVDVNEGPSWVKEMDVYDGTTGVLRWSPITENEFNWFDIDGFAFDERWLSKINTFKGNV